MCGTTGAGRAVPQFPDTVSKFLVLQNIFPDNLRRELLEKWLQRSGFLVLTQLAQNRPPAISKSMS
jgi:hypothetical protein